VGLNEWKAQMSRKTQAGQSEEEKNYAQEQTFLQAVRGNARGSEKG
jgi:hypothetical protein